MTELLQQSMSANMQILGVMKLSNNPATKSGLYWMHLNQHSIIYLMKQSDYHYEFNAFLTNCCEKLDNSEIESQNVQLEIKYGFLKKNKNETQFKSFVTSSQYRPIDLNEGKNKFNFRVNARCSPDEHTKARSVLNELAERADCQVDQKYHLLMNEGEEKYLYDCRYQEWIRVYKEQMVKYQSNFLFKNRLFRIDLSEKIKEEKKALEKIKDVFTYREKGTGVLRFKHIQVYHVHKYYQIWSSVVFETDDEDWFSTMKKLIYEKGDDITTDIKAIIGKKETEKHEIKHELQLKFTEEGIDVLRKGFNGQTKQIFSEAFNFATQLTLKNTRSQAELVKMMTELGLQERKEEPKEESAKQQEEKKKQEGTRKQQAEIKHEKPRVKESKEQKQDQIQYIVK